MNNWKDIRINQNLANVIFFNHNQYQDSLPLGCKSSQSIRSAKRLHLSRCSKGKNLLRENYQMKSINAQIPDPQFNLRKLTSVEVWNAPAGYMCTYSQIWEIVKQRISLEKGFLRQVKFWKLIWFDLCDTKMATTVHSFPKPLSVIALFAYLLTSNWEPYNGHHQKFQKVRSKESSQTRNRPTLSVNVGHQSLSMKSVIQTSSDNIMGINSNFPIKAMCNKRSLLNRESPGTLTVSLI